MARETRNVAGSLRPPGSDLNRGTPSYASTVPQSAAQARPLPPEGDRQMTEIEPLGATNDHPSPSRPHPIHGPIPTFVLSWGSGRAWAADERANTPATPPSTEREQTPQRTPAPHDAAFRTTVPPHPNAELHQPKNPTISYHDHNQTTTPCRTLHRVVSSTLTHRATAQRRNDTARHEPPGEPP